MRNATPFASGRRLDIVCLGRFGVDFYAQQIGARLEDVTSFAKYLGGSSANTAFGCARLGLKAGLISRVGDDAMGRFLVETIAREGCDVSHVGVDPARLTAAVVLGIEDKDTFPLIFLRENCADMAIGEAEIEEGYIASGTVTAHLQRLLPRFDLVIGTIEEFNIAGGSGDILRSLAAVREKSNAVLVVKRGPLGCAVIDGAIPRSLDEAFNGRGVEVEVLNVLGAGDAFSSGFLSGWVRAEDYDACARYANACGALVVSRHGCAPAMPTRVELDYFLANAERIPRPDQDATLTRLHRVTAPRTQRPEVFAFAFDHRNQFFDLAQQTGAAEARISRLKRLLVDAVAEVESARALQGRIGILCDDRYGQDALNAATGRGWWIGRPVELPGSNPVVFERGRSVGTALIAWPQEHIVKCLVQYHPDDAIGHRLEQEAQIRALYDAVQASGHELLLEIIPPKRLPREADAVYRALKRLYNLNIFPEWWKLEPMDEAQWMAIDALIAERDPHCRGVVLLGLNAPIDALAKGFRDARGSTTCRGFAVGRTVFQEPATKWLAGIVDDAELKRAVRANFEALIDAWRDARARTSVAESWGECRSETGTGLPSRGASST